MRISNLSSFDPLVRVVTTAGTPVRLSPYQIANTIAFNNNSGTPPTAATADTITDSASGFLTAGFSVGDSLIISGSSSNDNATGLNVKIATITSSTITLEKSGILTTEAAGQVVTLSNLDGFKIEDGVEVTIRARTANTGVICIAPTSARAVNTVSGYKRHARIEANQSIGVQVKNLKDLWIDATVSGESVEILLEK